MNATLIQNQIENQNQNIVKTTITFDDTDVIVYIKGNRNTTYIERSIYLHNDGISYDYVHFYGPITQIDEHRSRYEDVKPHDNYRSRKTWMKYKRLFDLAIETSTLIY